MKRSFWQRILFKLRRWLGLGSKGALANNPQAAAPKRPEAEAPQAAQPQPSSAPPPSPSPAGARADGAAVFGIDFGTTFTSVAFVDEERLTLLREGFEPPGHLAPPTGVDPATRRRLEDLGYIE